MMKEMAGETGETRTKLGGGGGLTSHKTSVCVEGAAVEENTTQSHETTPGIIPPAVDTPGTHRVNQAPQVSAAGGGNSGRGSRNGMDQHPQRRKHTLRDIHSVLHTGKGLGDPKRRSVCGLHSNGNGPATTARQPPTAAIGYLDPFLVERRRFGFVPQSEAFVLSARRDFGADLATIWGEVSRNEDSTSSPTSRMKSSASTGGTCEDAFPGRVAGVRGASRPGARAARLRNTLANHRPRSSLVRLHQDSGFVWHHRLQELRAFVKPRDTSTKWINVGTRTGGEDEIDSVF